MNNPYEYGIYFEESLPYDGHLWCMKCDEERASWELFYSTDHPTASHPHEYLCKNCFELGRSTVV
jgi:hypothetical protein